MRADRATAAEALARIERLGVVPILTVRDEADAVPAADALAAGGLPCVEVTLRTDAGLPAIAEVARAAPDVLVGAGTVVSVEQAEAAIAAGADFVVTPGFDESVVEWGVAHDVLVLPGVMTPTEMMSALGAGVTVAKLFPAEVAGGTALLDAVGSVFPSLRFVPTGGVTTAHLADYLSRGNVVACGGSWMFVAPDVESAAREAVEIVATARGSAAGR